MSLGTQYLVTVLFGPSTAQCIYSPCVCTCHDYKLVWIVLFTDSSSSVFPTVCNNTSELTRSSNKCYETAFLWTLIFRMTIHKQAKEPPERGHVLAWWLQKQVQLCC